MKVLYAALRNDPRDPDRASGVDYNFYTAICENGHEVKIAGPVASRLGWLEKGVKKAHDLLTRKRYLKWDWGSVRYASKLVNQMVAEWQPDVVFSMFPAPLAFYTGRAPAIFNTDLAFEVWAANGGGFSWPATKLLSWLEGRAIHNSSRVILFSDFWKQEMIRIHKAPAGKFEVLPMPAALPYHIVPPHIDIQQEKKLELPLRLLLVGKEFHRKGVDIAAETVAQLNQQGIPAGLTVCATTGPKLPYTTYVGPFRKSDPEQLAGYAALYRQAHLLLHPARFEPAGIVPGEAAAFATPTLTNDFGGLGTTVKDQVSGIVLPKHSPAGAYTQAILALLNQPDRYYQLCATTRQRYDQELNWRAAGKTVNNILHEAIAK